MSARSLIALSVLLLAAPASAQSAAGDAPAAATMTLADAVSAARQNVPSVLAAAGVAQSARGEVSLAASARYPIVTGNASAAAAYQNSDTSGGTSSGIGTICTGGTCTPRGPQGYAYLDVGLTARWTIWDFGRTGLNVRAARLEAAGAEADVRAAERTAISVAATAYFGLLADLELIDAAHATLLQRQHQLEIARGRVDAGVDPAINATRAEIAAASAALAEQTAQASAANDAAALAAALGMDPAHPPRVVRPPEITLELSPEQAADEAVRARPEVVAAQRRVESALADLALARAGWRPSLGATGSAGGRYTEATTGTTTLSESALGIVTLSVPIYDASIAANVHIAEGRLVTARAQLAEQSLAVRTDAVQATLAVRAAREQLEQAEHNAELATANLALAEGRFQTGAAPLLELVDAQAEDATARLAVIQRRFQLGAATVRLLASLGRLEQLGGR